MRGQGCRLATTQAARREQSHPSQTPVMALILFHRVFGVSRELTGVKAPHTGPTGGRPEAGLALQKPE